MLSDCFTLVMIMSVSLEKQSRGTLAVVIFSMLMMNCMCVCFFAFVNANTNFYICFRWTLKRIKSGHKKIKTHTHTPTPTQNAQIHLAWLVGSKRTLFESTGPELIKLFVVLMTRTLFAFAKTNVRTYVRAFIYTKKKNQTHSSQK